MPNPQVLTIARINPQRHGIVRFKNGGSVDLWFSLESLRPRATWTSDYDEVVLVMREEDLEQLEGKWFATIKGRDAVYEGPVAVEVSPHVSDFSEWLDRYLNGDVEDDGA